MKVRITDKPEVTGSSGSFNVHGIGEVIVMFDDGSADSMFISDLDVLLENLGGVWMHMRDAFKQHYLITDNYNTVFFEPKHQLDKDRGYTL
jgi:hypothetical protein